jgi:hypothetical protein
MAKVRHVFACFGGFLPADFAAQTQGSAMDDMKKRISFDEAVFRMGARNPASVRGTG